MHTSSGRKDDGAESSREFDDASAWQTPPPPRNTFRALGAGIVAGVVSGFLLGGVGGRIVMRVIALIDPSTDGAETDFGTVGEITVGGSLTLAILTSITGAMGGLAYVAVRRWLPGSTVRRGLFFGLVMMFGPGFIALGEVDLQIFEPAVPVFAAFVALVVTYGIGVAILADRLHPSAAVTPGPRMEAAARWAVRLLSVGVLAMAVLATGNVYDHEGSCLSADEEGGCAVRTSD